MRRLFAHAALLAIVAGSAACAPLAPLPAVSTAPAAPTAPAADVLNVAVQGEPGAYHFSVEIASPDTGCDQYADWWEVLDRNGSLLYRRILTHSHVEEQPFVRSGGPVAIALDTEVWVRAHLYPTGYGGQAMRGSVAGGFAEAAPPPEWAVTPAGDLARPDCAF